MLISLDRSVSYKQAAFLGALFCFPFLIAITSAVTSFKPLESLLVYQGRATAAGLGLFYIAMVGLPLAFIVNLLSMLSVRIKLEKSSIEGKNSFHPKPINVIIGGVGLLIAIVFGGHLIIDSVACMYGNLRACD